MQMVSTLYHSPPPWSAAGVPGSALQRNMEKNWGSGGVRHLWELADPSPPLCGVYSACVCVCVCGGRGCRCVGGGGVGVGVCGDVCGCVGVGVSKLFLGANKAISYS